MIAKYSSHEGPPNYYLPVLVLGEGHALKSHYLIFDPSHIITNFKVIYPPCDYNMKNDINVLPLNTTLFF